MQFATSHGLSDSLAEATRQLVRQVEAAKENTLRTVFTLRSLPWTPEGWRRVTLCRYDGRPGYEEFVLDLGQPDEKRLAGFQISGPETFPPVLQVEVFDQPLQV